MDGLQTNGIPMEAKEDLFLIFFFRNWWYIYTVLKNQRLTPTSRFEKSLRTTRWIISAKVDFTEFSKNNPESKILYFQRSVFSWWEDMNNSMFCSWKIGRDTESQGNYLVHHEAEKRLNTKEDFSSNSGSATCILNYIFFNHHHASWTVPGLNFLQDRYHSSPRKYFFN